VNADGGTGKEGRELGRTFVVADLPGLIEGAHEGAGLGIRFLRHVERTRLLVHLIDTSDASVDDPIHAFEIISGELHAFSEQLTEKPMIVAATKLDATTDRTKLDELREFCAGRGFEFHAISAPTGEGVRELVRSIADALDKIPKHSLASAAFGDSDDVDEETGAPHDFRVDVRGKDTAVGDTPSTPVKNL
jgi:Obg family GTPase CgtA